MRGHAYGQYLLLEYAITVLTVGPLPSKLASTSLSHLVAHCALHTSKNKMLEVNYGGKKLK